MLLPPLRLLLELLNLWEPLSYDIIHVFGPLCLAFVPLLPLFYLRGVKIYVSYHVYLEFYARIYCGTSQWALYIMELLFSLYYFIPFVGFADMVGIPSQIADQMVYKYSKRIHIMKSGLDTNKFKPVHEMEPAYQEPPWGFLRLPYSGPTLVYVGRLAGEKNAEFLIKAMGHSKLHGYTLIFVGDGPSRKGLERLAIKVVGKENVILADECIGQGNAAVLNDDDDARSEDSSVTLTSPTATPPTNINQRITRVIFTGMILDQRIVAEHYAHADVFVSASASETFGFTVAEAMACGIPAVVVRSGAFKKVYKCIDDWMFEPDSIQDYVNKVSLVVRESVKARDLARRLAVKKFGMQGAVQDLLRTYSMIVHERYPRFTEGKYLLDTWKADSQQQKQE
jgi:glycosyltransferase involved in cell wall biosynthesis